MDFMVLLLILATPIAAVIGAVLGAFILEAACALCGVEDLRFLKALILAVVITVINFGVIVALVFWIGAIGASHDLASTESRMLAVVVAYPLTLLIAALLLRLTLPIGYLKGILIAFLQGVIVLVFASVLGGLALVALAAVQLATAS